MSRHAYYEDLKALARDQAVDQAADEAVTRAGGGMGDRLDPGVGQHAAGMD